MPKRTWTTEQFIDAVQSHTSIAQVLNALGLRPAGGNYKKFHQYSNELGIDTSHLLGKGWNKGKAGTRKAIPLSSILTENSHYQSSKLRKRLIKEKVFEKECSNCNLREWNGFEIPLELDHINGVNTDNRIVNLRLLCPNCHALTPTYRGKNISKHG